MDYIDGQEAMLGNEVIINSQDKGTVVACIDSCKYTVKYSESDWAYLLEGILIHTDFGGHCRSGHAHAVVRAAGRAEGTVLFGIGRVSSGQCAIDCIQGSATPTRALPFLNTPTPQPRQHGQTVQNGNLVKALYLASTNLLECPDVDCE